MPVDTTINLYDEQLIIDCFCATSCSCSSKYSWFFSKIFIYRGQVALIYPNNDPISFLCAFYGCLTAGVVPVPIEVPISKRVRTYYVSVPSHLRHLFTSWEIFSGEREKGRRNMIRKVKGRRNMIRKREIKKEWCYEISRFDSGMRQKCSCLREWFDGIVDDAVYVCQYLSTNMWM